MHHTLGERIKRAREEKDLTPEALAQLVQWDARRIGMVESGEIPALPLFEVCELGLALEVTPQYLELGMGGMTGNALSKKVKDLVRSARNFVDHCRHYALVRFERYLLWTKVMEASSHRGVISPTAWRSHQVSMLGSLQRPVCAARPRPQPVKRREPRSHAGQPCMCQDRVFRNRHPGLPTCPFCGRDLLEEL